VYRTIPSQIKQTDIMKTNKEMDVYVQPDCKVCQVQWELIIATSDSQGSTESLDEEDFNW